MKRVIASVAVVLFLIVGASTVYLSKSNPMLVAMTTAVLESSAAPFSTKGIKTPRFFSSLPAHCGFIDSEGKLLFKPYSKYDDSGDFHEGLAAFRRGLQWGFIDKHGNEVIAPQFSRVRDFSEGLAAVRVDKVWTFCNRRGRLVIKPTAWCSAASFESGIAIVKQGAKYGLVNQSGDLVHQIDLDSIDKAQDGIYRVSQSKKIGFIDKLGEVIVDPKYDDAADFSEGLCAVSESGKWGYINKSGAIAIRLKFQSAQEFRHGKAVVKDENKFRLIDRDGRKFGKSEFGYMTAISDMSIGDVQKVPPSFIPVLSGDKGWNFVDARTGKEISKVAFASVHQFSDGAAAVEIYDSPNSVKQEIATLKQMYNVDESDSDDTVETKETEIKDQSSSEDESKDSQN